MKAKVLSVHWHIDNQPIYSAHFQPGRRQLPPRLATAAGDNNVRIWRLQYDETGAVSGVNYLATLSKHTQAVNVVRFDPKGTTLASAGDDGTILLWSLQDAPAGAAGNSNGLGTARRFGEDDDDAVETWIMRRACRGGIHEIYDIAWSPDSQYIIAGSVEGMTRIYNSSNGQCVANLAQHSNYVQGVAWDPLNQYVATQSSDRSVHIYTLRSKNGQFALGNTTPYRISRAEFPFTRKAGASTPAPAASQQTPAPTGAPVSVGTPTHTPSLPPPLPGASPAASHASLASSIPTPDSSTPFGPTQGAADHGTPASMTSASSPPETPRLMHPPLAPTSSRPHSRKSSFSSAHPESPGPGPAFPLPAVRQVSSPVITPLSVSANSPSSLVRSSMLYHNETFTSFFRRLTFTPDGSLLFTPSGLFKYTPVSGPSVDEETTNTVYVYSRAGLNRPPVAHLPGLHRPSLAVKCSPVFYQLREGLTAKRTARVTIDMTLDSKAAGGTSDSTPATPATPIVAETLQDDEGLDSPVFKLQYRIIYAVATQDSVIVYDTQQKHPLCIVSNLHYGTFTDLTWSPDGNTLIMASTDGFCSVISFEPGELGEVYTASSAPESSKPSGPHSVVHSPLIPMASLHTLSDGPVSAASPASTTSSTNESQTLIPAVSHFPVSFSSGASPSAPSSPTVKRMTDDEVPVEDGKKRRRIAPTLVTSLGPEVLVPDVSHVPEAETPEAAKFSEAKFSEAKVPEVEVETTKPEVPEVANELPQSEPTHELSEDVEPKTEPKTEAPK